MKTTTPAKAADATASHSFKLAAWGARWAWCQRRKTLGNVGSFTL
jgi:hypothetical protein